MGAFGKVLSIFLSIFEMDKPQIYIFREKSLNYTCYDSKWIPKSARFVVLGCMPRQTGVIEIMKLTSTGLESQAQVRNIYLCSLCYFNILLILSLIPFI